MWRSSRTGFKLPRGHGLLVAALLVLVPATQAQDDIEREGYFEVRSASMDLREGVYMLDARLQLVLSSEALDALNSTVPLTIELQMRLFRKRAWYLDASVADLVVSYELEYRPVSQRYIVRNVRSGDQESFATLYSALNYLGRVQDLPVIDAPLLEEGREYRVRLRALLSTEQYSAPLRLIFFWRDEWQLKSEWYEWTLER